MAIVYRQLLWALLIAGLSLPVMYLLAMMVLSVARRGYVRVDPVLLRRISLGLSLAVFAAVLIVERLR